MGNEQDCVVIVGGEAFVKRVSHPRTVDTRHRIILGCGGGPVSGRVSAPSLDPPAARGTSQL